MSSSQYNPDNELDDAEIVTLTDESGRSLECYIENALETEDVAYLLLMPIDTPVVILALDDEAEEDDLSETFLIEDETEIVKIFADAKAVLAELDLTLKHTAYTLTVSGELPPLEDEGILTLELNSEEQERLEPEELQFLASFYHLDQKYSIYTPLTPLLFLATYDNFGKIELVSPDDEDIQPILEDLLFDEMD
ncbi:DUF3727 domain-containing protein [Gloeothece verrucosa]|uniref:DUF3727 domain-containing protein n=1 Tax=Gloeothece verrucosa (strain PCC 7822) TaxID=497965 RepID=E0UBJ6_GLOV7|nr:DUF3727 domain-containing protein [Gloeothece verrucosa]ADN13940.1 protein of unknown function DUF1292 [Gloeothece verrucosa PCC 7822]